MWRFVDEIKAQGHKNAQWNIGWMVMMMQVVPSIAFFPYGVEPGNEGIGK